MTFFVGESLVGDGNEIAHIDLLIGTKDGPVGTAFANALATQSNGHSNLLAVLTPNVAVKPSTVMITKVTIKGSRQAVQMFGPAQEAVARAVADSVKDGVQLDDDLKEIEARFVAELEKMKEQFRAELARAQEGPRAELAAARHTISVLRAEKVDVQMALHTALGEKLDLQKALEAALGELAQLRGQAQTVAAATDPDRPRGQLGVQIVEMSEEQAAAVFITRFDL